MNSLAYTPPKPAKSDNPTPVSIVSEDEADPKPQYPSFRLNGEQAKDAKLDKCSFGEEYEIKVRIRATRIGGDEYEMKKDGLPPITFDVISSDDPVEVTPESSESETTTSKTDRFKKSVKGPKDLGMEKD